MTGRGRADGRLCPRHCPFYGQGMNSGMEDCTVLDELLDEHDNWEGIMTAYTALRKPAGDAIMELALQNYIEMRDLTGDAHS